MIAPRLGIRSLAVHQVCSGIAPLAPARICHRGGLGLSPRRRRCGGRVSRSAAATAFSPLGGHASMRARQFARTNTRRRRKLHGSRHDGQGEAAGREGPRHGARGDHAAGGRVRGRGRQGRPLELHQAPGGDPRRPQGQGARARPVEFLADRAPTRATASPRSNMPISPRKWAGRGWRPRPSTARPPTPATWR